MKENGTCDSSLFTSNNTPSSWSCNGSWWVIQWFSVPHWCIFCTSHNHCDKTSFTWHKKELHVNYAVMNLSKNSITKLNSRNRFCSSMKLLTKFQDFHGLMNRWIHQSLGIINKIIFLKICGYNCHNIYVF